jgi:hypothetical protein
MQIIRLVLLPLVSESGFIAVVARGLSEASGKNLRLYRSD